MERAKEVAAKLGRTTLTRAEFSRETGFSPNQVFKHFDGMRDLCRQAGLDPYERNVRLERTKSTRRCVTPSWSSAELRPELVLTFRGLQHAPVNEQGRVFLFGMVAHELGYLVESVQQAYPDCDAKRRVARDRWKRVRIEFEYCSRSFRDHGHDPSSCDLVVCWEHDWPDCPLEVLELRSAIRRLPA